MSGTLNTKVFDDIVAKLDGINLCKDLQDFTSVIMADLNKQLAWIKDQIESLAPFADLLEAPGADLAKLATWAEKMISALVQPGYQAYLKMMADLETLTTQITRVMAAITAAAARITSCAITFPVTEIVG
ncbi:hypothetical protein [Gluconobacter thailandicus]|uniref:Uncharacterized protein n=1 Tax=Gluconobacter thailandicus TaxID=257438 RepID=A0AAP9EUA4_GLUTH|nr:hypothetical protein [Gluconobacter thailandicus]QEH97274.1 hypothetical protein FXF46_14215 [Gluconobacter thailandicus]